MSPVVEVVEQDADRRVQRAEVEEGLVSEPGQDPPLGQEYGGFDRGLVAGFRGPRRDHDGAVVGGEVLVGAIDAWLVAAGARDGALELVGDPPRVRSSRRSMEMAT